MGKDILHLLIPEQINPFYGSPFSVTPQLWSQAEFLNTYIYLISKIKMFNK